jgi:hypothetical protein
MPIKNAVGRPSKLNFKIVNKLYDSISHNYSIGDSCKFAKISRSSYYYYLNTNSVFANEMELARKNQSKVSFNFRTYQ